MIIMMPENKVKGAAKRLRKILLESGIELKHVPCLELSAKLFGFNNWQHYLGRDRSEPFSPFDHQLSESEFAERDAFQMSVLKMAGFGAVARELLDRVNPSGSWAKTMPDGQVAPSFPGPAFAPPVFAAVERRARPVGISEGEVS